MCFLVTLIHEKALSFTGDQSGRKDGGGKTGNERTESNTASVDISSNIQKKKRLNNSYKYHKSYYSY